MSFSDRPMLTGLQKAGCASVALIGIAVSFIGFIGHALGSCPECDPNRLVHFLAFPGVQITFVGVGVLMIWRFTRSEN